MSKAQRTGKHRKQSRRSKRIAAVGVATATATALTVGLAPPPDTNTAKIPVALMASTGPDYTQIIENTSNSLDNILFTQANLTNALGTFLNPLGAASGGLLPTFGATVGQDNLLTVDGLVGALLYVVGKLGTLPDFSTVPGLPADANDVLGTNLLAALAEIAPSLAPLLGVVDDLGDVPGALDDTLTTLAGINTQIDTLLGPLAPQIGIPDVTDLLASLGLTATETHYDSTFSWPILGIGGTSNVTNLFAQIPSLTAGALANALLGQLDIPDLSLLGIPLPPPLDDLPGLVDDALSPLDALLATPSITAWVPSASGLYTLPLGGSLGYLATMPVVDVGPITVAGIPISDSDTVLAIPIGAAGINLPLGLASYGVLSTPGLVFPTATGVSSLGGTTLQSLTLLGLVNLTNLNTLNAFYIGTNGININTGQNVGALVTPLGTLPFQFSLGSFNIGTTGLGFTGPSIAGIGLLPPIQIGTAPVQTSDDGLLPAALINTGLLIPTQGPVDVATLLGLPNIQTTVINPFVNPVFNSTFAPLGAQLTAFLNANVGSWANQGSDLVLQLTTAIEQLSESLPGATPKPVAEASTLNATLAANSKTVAPTSKTPLLTKLTGQNVANASIAPKNGPVLNIIRGGINQPTAGTATATATATSTTTHPTPVKNAVNGLGSEVKKAVTNVSKALGAGKKVTSEKKSKASA